MPINYMEEDIPDIRELNDYANALLNKINIEQPVKILGNLIDKKTKKYMGQKYFYNIEKNVAVGNSKKNNDFSGLYIFYNKAKVEYVGISNSIVRRLRSHLVSTNNTQSSLVYMIAKKMYENEKSIKYKGIKNDFPFEKYRNKIQKNITNEWKIKVLRIENGFKLVYLEIYIASTLKSYWNSFKPN